MTEPLLIGTRGWDHAAWDGQFYPAELPADWRFSFYCNRLRSVLLPAEAWAAVDMDEVRRWGGDCDAQFQFVLELPPGLSTPMARDEFDARWAGFRALMDPIHARTVGLLLGVSDTESPDRDWLAHVLSVLTSDKPVCVDLPPGGWRSNGLPSLLANTGAGLCWHADQEPGPQPGGRLMLGLTPGGKARQLRHSIEQIGRASCRERV